MLLKLGSPCSNACSFWHVHAAGTASRLRKRCVGCQLAQSNSEPLENSDGSHIFQQQQQHEQQQEQRHLLQQQQQQQSDPPTGYDPKAAAGFMPPPGEKPMWWVEMFEERRRKLAEEQAKRGSSSSSSDAPSACSPAAAPAAAPAAGSRTWLPKAALQLLQLAVVNAALILWPASLYPGGLAAGQVWLLYWTYMLFFAGGSVYRLVKYGPLAARKKDVQGRTWWSTAAWMLFIVSIPILHWPPVGGFLRRQQQLAAAYAPSGFVTAYNVLGFGFLAAAVALNWWSARHLGRAYDRVVAPDALVTDGPYAYVQHPIYSSYIMLFMGYGLVLHSASTAFLALAVCLVYYLSRTRLEKRVLQQAFGQEYEQYSTDTKLFVPFVF